MWFPYSVTFMSPHPSCEGSVVQGDASDYESEDRRYDSFQSWRFCPLSFQNQRLLLLWGSPKHKCREFTTPRGRRATRLGFRCRLSNFRDVERFANTNNGTPVAGRGGRRGAEPRKGGAVPAGSR